MTEIEEMNYFVIVVDRLGELGWDHLDLFGREIGIFYIV
jgi:hypothetical protein